MRRQETNKKQAADGQNVQGEARERRETNKTKQCTVQAEDRQDDSGDMQNGQEEAGDRQEWVGVGDKPESPRI
jgi:hypothetical protein